MEPEVFDWGGIEVECLPEMDNYTVFLCKRLGWQDFLSAISPEFDPQFGYC